MIDLVKLKAYIAARVAHMPSGCWEWRGSVTRGGYGTVNNQGLKTTAHRAALLACEQQIPPGTEIDHLCKNSRCVNPAHLEAVTHLENVRRSSVAGKTHCANGHPFNEKNTFIKRNGCRSCRICNAARQRSLRQANPERYRSNEKRSRENAK